MNLIHHLFSPHNIRTKFYGLTISFSFSSLLSSPSCFVFSSLFPFSPCAGVVALGSTLVVGGQWKRHHRNSQDAVAVNLINVVVIIDWGGYCSLYYGGLRLFAIGCLSFVVVVSPVCRDDRWFSGEFVPFPPVPFTFGWHWWFPNKVVPVSAGSGELVACLMVLVFQRVQFVFWPVCWFLGQLKSFVSEFSGFSVNSVSISTE